MFHELLTRFNIILFGLWALSAALDYLDFCYIWQLKEYRLDRMRDYFSTRQGRHYWLNPMTVFRAVLVLGIALWPINEIRFLKQVVLFGLLLNIAFHCFKIFRQGIRRPKPTPKAILLVITAFFVEIALAFSQRDWGVVFVFMVARFFIMAATVFVWNQVTTVVKNLIIWWATRKIARYPHLKVIGITGSYGKSSVKEYVGQILSEKFLVIKTPGNINTDIGVAQFILRTDFSKADVFVVEMGAYRIGEIKKICNIVKPGIGILTSIIEQHLSLFGSIKNIQTAKYELLRSIPKTGLVITNADNAYCTELLSELDCQNQVLFGDDPSRAPEYLIGEVESKPEGVHWKLVVANENYDFFAPVLGAHQPFNFTPAIVVARRYGLSFAEIASALIKIKIGPNALSVYKYGQATIIDDTYNSNPKGFKAALDILSSFPSKFRRVVITRGMLELAERTEEYHARIGEEIAFCADELVIISPDFVDGFRVGIDALKNKFPLEVKTIFESDELLKYIQAKSKEPVVFLLENRLPVNVMKEIKP